MARRKRRICNRRYLIGIRWHSCIDDEVEKIILEIEYSKKRHVLFCIFQEDKNRKPCRFSFFRTNYALC